MADGGVKGALWMDDSCSVGLLIRYAVAVNCGKHHKRVFSVPISSAEPVWCIYVSATKVLQL